MIIISQARQNDSTMWTECEIIHHRCSNTTALLTRSLAPAESEHSIEILQVQSILWLTTTVCEILISICNSDGQLLPTKSNIWW